ncbi:DUF2059 domain-containing protein [Microbulbifer sp. JMSA004]|uniref:DUF2059 domain-containing protein n=1 Tax=Microbulbifer sp. JMSA004 TaxID=3243370 RepID=UPI004039C8D7
MPETLLRRRSSRYTGFRTETGQSMLVKMPTVMNDSMAISQQIVQSFIPKLRELSMAFKADLEEQRSVASETVQN